MRPGAVSICRPENLRLTPEHISLVADCYRVAATDDAMRLLYRNQKFTSKVKKRGSLRAFATVILL